VCDARHQQQLIDARDALDREKRRFVLRQDLLTAQEITDVTALFDAYHAGYKAILDAKIV